MTFNLIGWIGLVFVILAYILRSAKKLKIDYVLYHILNLFGLIGLALSTFLKEDWPAFTLFLIFGVISIVYIIKILSIKPVYKDLGN